MSETRDPLFAVSIVGRARPIAKHHPDTGARYEVTPPTGKHRLELIRHAGEVSARSSAVEAFERDYPEFEVFSVLVEPVEGI